LKINYLIGFLKIKKQNLQAHKTLFFVASLSCYPFDFCCRNQSVLSYLQHLEKG